MTFKRILAIVPILTLAGLCSIGGRALAQTPPHLGIAQPGGMPGLPVMTGICKATNGIVLTWDGPSGYYEVFQKTNIKNGTWMAVGRATNMVRTLTVAYTRSNTLFRVSGPSPHYIGIQACTACHSDTHATVMQTGHAQAFADLQQVQQQNNPACLPCHTVGANLPTGYTNQVKTANLENVQCENCHGPAANHAANPDDPTVVPRIEVAGTLCGGCHNLKSVPAQYAYLHPSYYEDWSASAHSAVVPDLKPDFLGTNGPSVYIPTCGACHSGTVREALLENEPMPNGTDAGAVGIACAVCHDPHQISPFTNVLNGVVSNRLTGVILTNTELGAVYTNQLRNPIASRLDYHATGSFATNYNPNISVCAQCHNDRGASTNDTSFPPHHSPQYNMLLGTLSPSTGVPTNQPATHALLEKQCVSCHMQTCPQNGALPPGSGHSFAINSYALCLNCHPNPAGLVQFTGMAVSNQVQEVKALLDLWATTAAPPALLPYGTRAWEYTTPGELSPGGPGPSTAQQALIPAAIKQARMNLYLVLHDGSFGAHNGPYAVQLLDTAENDVVDALYP